jgi:adenylate cyclase, class 2
MQTEIEAKFLDIDPDVVREKLKALGATLVHPEFLMCRKVYDFPDLRLEAQSAWIRVRKEAEEVTLSYKKTEDWSLHGTKEIQVVVDDFDKTCQILELIGLESKAYQETKREKWLLHECEVTIDTWPWIPTFVEIEGPSEASVKSAADLLGFEWSHATHGSVEPVYQKYFDVSIDEVRRWKEIVFGEVPGWLKEKAKK